MKCMLDNNVITTEIFEITDYTNSTEFEEFIYSVEQVIEAWGINKGVSWSNKSLPEFNRSESLSYGQQSFRLTHSTHIENNLLPLQQVHFPSKAHCINRWYGFTEFLILSPETTKDAIYFLDSSKLLMSSLAVALTRTQCAIPIFIQLGSPSKRFYSGIWLNNCIQTTLDMVLLKTPPPQCSTLKELLCFFKRSIPCAATPFPQTLISVRYTFCLQNFIGCFNDNQLYPQNSFDCPDLPFGAARDPVQDILLATTLVGLSEHLISDSESGELDPLKSPSWSIRCTNTSNPFCILYKYVDYVSTLFTNESSLVSFLGVSSDDNIEVDVSAAFRNITKHPPILHVPTIDISMLPGKLLGTYGALVDKDIISSFMHYIFGSPYNEDVLIEQCHNSSNIKSCPRDSISHRITICLTLILCNHGGVKGFAQLWRCIVEEFRSLFEKSNQIPGANNQPDPAFSLLHQKIQMLNACIKHKSKRESIQYSSDVEEREALHDQLTLLLTGERLRIPTTQTHPPMTEDMQEEHMEALEQLGSSAEGSRLRTELHSLSLLSDMQAFKASNSNCRLEDFIRWYSPRDWINITQHDGMNVADDGYSNPETREIEEKDDIFDLENCRKINKTEGGEHDSKTKADNVRENVVFLADIAVDIKPDVSTRREAEEHGSTSELNSNSDCELDRENSRTSGLTSNSEDEFVDATEEMEEGTSEQSDLSLVPKAVSYKSVSSQQCFDDTIKYEQPLDPQRYGGHLSDRMSRESVWKELWYIAKPIPIRNQKRLFDDTKEAEKILHYFTQSQIKTITMLIMPTLLHAAYDKIAKCPESSLPFMKDRLLHFHQKLKDIQRYPKDDTENLHDIKSNIHDCELMISKYFSVRTKLAQHSPIVQKPDTPKKISELEKRTRRKCSKLSADTLKTNAEQPVDEEHLLEQLLSAEVEVGGAARSNLGIVLQRLFHAQQVAAIKPAQPPSAQPRQVPILPLPVGREYILQTVTKHPSPASRDCPQRMFVAVSNSEFRMAFANSSDKKFL